MKIKKITMTYLLILKAIARGRHLEKSQFLPFFSEISNGTTLLLRKEQLYDDFDLVNKIFTGRRRTLHNRKSKPKR